mmetsp:Transcript_9413/g.25396  ORF Transcript_9413/g.25396 Transcript_9413/m.25396 type:complete len:205 (+) Transcript_9413:247-861(+)
MPSSLRSASAMPSLFAAVLSPLPLNATASGTRKVTHSMILPGDTSLTQCTVGGASNCPPMMRCIFSNTSASDSAAVLKVYRCTSGRRLLHVAGSNAPLKASTNSMAEAGRFIIACWKTMPPGGAQKPSGMAGGPFGSLKEPSAASAAAAAADDAVAGSSCRGRLLLFLAWPSAASTVAAAAALSLLLLLLAWHLGARACCAADA